MAAIEPPALDKVSEVESALISSEPVPPKVFTLRLSQFKDLIRHLSSEPGSNLQIDIVLNGQWALAQFKGLHPHRIRIVPDSLFNKVRRLLGVGLTLDEDDFEIAAAYAAFHGSRRPIHLLGFLREESPGVQVLLLSIFLVTGFAIRSTTQIEVIKTANDVIIQVSAIFFSVFMIFVAAQGLPSRLQQAAFAQGLTHRFFAIDRYVSIFSLLALSLAGATRILVEFPSPLSFKVLDGASISLNIMAVSPWTTALAISLMAFSLTTFIGYYLVRTRYSFESEMSKDLLDGVLEDSPSDKD